MYRISLPVTDDDNPKSLYAKLVKFAKIIDIPNSISIIDDLWPVRLLTYGLPRFGRFAQ
jgi:hypothetical protein